ncbi:aldo/keto reductase [Clostridia bacterium]|nr:aldo/keto reductase [Clostridia bacterium]
MNYRTNPKNGDKISPLAFGCMRFPKDDNELKKQIEYAVSNGINYFDTAYSYPKSEERLGRALSKETREKIKIATKLPLYMVRKYEDFDKIFNKQLQRLRTTYIDYYLMHMITDLNTWETLVSLGIVKWISEKKKNGQIINIGFSYHGGKIEFEKVLDSYDWEFCMIQYNYFDEFNQTGKAGLQYAAAKGLPVMIMEPLRGGELAKLPHDAEKVFESSGESRTPADWSFSWLLNQKEVLTVLSGMNTLEMIEENIKTADRSAVGVLTDADLERYAKVREILKSKGTVGCTGCAYCMPCPKGVDIPLCFSAYNDYFRTPKSIAKFRYLTYTVKHNASMCVSCGACETHCPQKIEIRKELRAVAKTMEGIFYRPAAYVIRKLMKL